MNLSVASHLLGTGAIPRGRECINLGKMSNTAPAANKTCSDTTKGVLTRFCQGQWSEARGHIVWIDLSVWLPRDDDGGLGVSSRCRPNRLGFQGGHLGGGARFQADPGDVLFPKVFAVPGGPS
jgi:hypothetical protein